VKPVELVLQRLGDYEKRNGDWKAICPAHDDRNPSLSVSQGDDERVVIKCFAGCTPEAIVDAVGLRMADLFNADRGGGRSYPSLTPTGRLVITNSLRWR